MNLIKSISLPINGKEYAIDLDKGVTPSFAQNLKILDDMFITKNLVINLGIINDTLNFTLIKNTYSSSKLFELFNNLGLYNVTLKNLIDLNDEIFYIDYEMYDEIQMFTEDNRNYINHYLFELSNYVMLLYNAYDLVIQNMENDIYDLIEDFKNTINNFDNYTISVLDCNLKIKEFLNINYQNLNLPPIMHNSLTGEYYLLENIKKDDSYGILYVQPNINESVLITNNNSIYSNKILTFKQFITSFIYEFLKIGLKHNKLKDSDQYYEYVENLDILEYNIIDSIHDIRIDRYLELLNKIKVKQALNYDILNNQNIKYNSSKHLIDVTAIKEQYKDDQYAQSLYNAEQPYYKDFDLEDLNLYVSGIANGDIYSLLFVGESGTGKSTIAKVLSSKAGLPCITINLSANTEESDLFGSVIPNPDSNANNPFIWKDGLITKAIRNGYVCILDEINFAKPSILGKLNSLLDETRQIDLDNGEVVKAHDNFRIIATCNIAYEGTNRFNKALINRFEIVKRFDSINNTKLKSIIMSRTNYKQEEKIIQIIDVYNSIIKYSNANNLDLIVSVRQLLTLFTTYKYYTNLKEAILNTLVHNAFIEDAEYESDYISTVLDSFDLNFKL